MCSGMKECCVIPGRRIRRRMQSVGDLLNISRLLAPPIGSPKCLRFGLWLTVWHCTLNVDLLTYLLTNQKKAAEGRNVRRDCNKPAVLLNLGYNGTELLHGFPDYGWKVCWCLCVCRELGRYLLRFVRLFVSRCHYQLTESSMRRAGVGDVSVPLGRVGTVRCVDGDLVRCVFTKINRVDSVQSYNLPSLELTLFVLMHITARYGNCCCCCHCHCIYYYKYYDQGSHTFWKVWIFFL